jgi:uncharacterized membrane protein YhaH (DUF805 family)
MALELNPYAAPQAVVANAAEDEVQDVRLFTASGRVGRVRYLNYLAGYYILFVLVVGGIAGGMAGMGMHRGTPMLVVMGIGYVGLIALVILLTIQRCHDFDGSGWWVLLGLVPVVNVFFGLLLAFKSGTDGGNRFGARTPANSTLSVILACVFPTLMVVGIVAAIAIPAYSDYSKRAQRSQMQMPR